MNHIAKVANVNTHWPLLLFLSFSLLMFSCDNETATQTEKVIYQGPMRTLKNAEIFHSDSGRVKALVKTKMLHNLQNEDREVPEGMFITFYEKDGSISATLEADYAYYTNETKIWKAQGNVIIHNMENEETLKTEELFWDPNAGDVSTEKFVKIETPEEIITGTGLKAKQDFSSWSINQPEGIFVIEDDEGAEEL